MVVSVPRNYFLVPGVTRYTRSQVQRMKLAEKAGKRQKQVQKDTLKKKAPRRKGVKRTKFYPAERLPKPKLSRKSKTSKPTKLRSNITPGTILILLAGRHRGKRVVFLKQLSSGLLLVTGPHFINRVPLRRVDQAFVIATSTKLELPFEVDAKFDDAYFRRMVKKIKQSKEEKFFSHKKTLKKYKLSKERRTDQKAMDKLIKPLLSKQPELRAYLKSKFSLTHGVFPHLLKF